MLGIVVLARVGAWYRDHRRRTAHHAAPSRALPLPSRQVALALAILVLLTTTKNVYVAGISSYFTFFTIERFGLDVRDAQLCSSSSSAPPPSASSSADPIGDRFGARFVIWFSILGVIPFALLLPYADLFWTGVLSVIVGVIFASAFPAIVVFAQELVPGRVGLIAGVFFGFAFGTGGLGAALLGALADTHGIAFVYWLCSFLPLLGLLTVFLPSRAPHPRGDGGLSAREPEPLVNSGLYLYRYSRMARSERGIVWVGDARKALLEFPKEVRIAIGHALSEAQVGRKVDYAKPMKGFGVGVFEIVADFDRDTYRGVYAVKLGADVYVLHAFKKKSTSGIATPKPDIDLIRRRIKQIQSIQPRSKP